MGLEVGQKVALKQPLTLSNDGSHYIGTYKYRLFKKTHGRWVPSESGAPQRLRQGTRGTVIHREFFWTLLCYVDAVMFRVDRETMITIIIGPEAERASEGTSALGIEEAPLYGYQEDQSFFSKIKDSIGKLTDAIFWPAAPVADDILRDLENY